MPHYYFEVSHSGFSCGDDEGQTFPSPQAALDAARRLAAELAIELPELSGFSITVSDDRGEIIGRALISSPPKVVLQ